MTRRPPKRKPAPSWATVMQMEQARWRHTARQHRHQLPTRLAHLADAEHISRRDAQALAAWCAKNNLPLARAGRN